MEIGLYYLDCLDSRTCLVHPFCLEALQPVLEALLLHHVGKLGQSRPLFLHCELHLSCRAEYFLPYSLADDF